MGERPRSPGFIQSISKAQLKVVGLLDAAGAPVGGVDTTAIHKATAAEISAMTAKGTPTTSDFLVIEDAAAANAKKRITIGDLPAAAAVGMTSVVRTVSTTDATQTAIGASLAPTADSTLIANLRLVSRRDNGDWASFQFLGAIANDISGIVTVTNGTTSSAPDNSLNTGSVLRLAVDQYGGLRARITAAAGQNWDHSLVIEYLELIA